MGEITEAAIADYGVFLPLYRIDFAEIPKFYGKRGRGAETLVVPGLDEDSITMAYAAVREFLSSEDRVDAIVFATISPPIYYKKVSALLGRALDLPDDILTFDVGGSPKASMDALRLGADLVGSGSAARAVVVASDYLYTGYGWETEVFPSAGAAAFLISRDGFARLGESARVCLEVYDFWKLEEENQLQFHMDIHGLTFGEASAAAVDRLSKKTGTKLEDYSFVCYQQLHPRFTRNPLFRKVQKDILAATDVMSKVGNLFTASLPLSMALGFDKARVGDKMCAISYGSGESEAWELEIVAEPPARRSVEEKMGNGMKIDIGKFWQLIHGRRNKSWKK